ncbi:MAG: hypothetical protein LBH96_03735, partial [Candidatus Peribacteria bacterium]|nr:hypothetical protein [Candidatus Peribacteria bacterium]
MVIIELGKVDIFGLLLLVKLILIDYDLIYHLVVLILRTKLMMYIQLLVFVALKIQLHRFKHEPVQTSLQMLNEIVFPKFNKLGTIPQMIFCQLQQEYTTKLL